MPIATRTFRVFVSSTFEDLKAERDTLQHDVFPKLRALCEQHGARFQAIDLRWGVRDEAALDQQTVEICLREIRRCQATGVRPNFIVLLGDRYGWQPLPARVPAAELEVILPHIPAGDARALAEQWYRLDENAVPPEYCLQPRTGEFVAPAVWTPLEQTLREAMAKAARAAGLPEKELIKYEASATHQEILAGMGETEEDRQHVSAFVRRPAGNTDPRVEELKSDLPVHDFDPDAIYDRLRQVIEAEIKRFEDRPALDLEVEAHDRFAEERCRIFTGRAAILDTIADYLQGPDRRPLVLHGESGSGKSAVMAKASQQYQGPGRVIRRFIGASPESASGHALLTSLCRQIAPGETPVDYAQLENAFRERLSVATPEQPLVLFVDALDQLAVGDPARDVTWLPPESPPHVKVIVSTTDDGQRLPESLTVQLESMAKSEGGQALDEWMREAHRTLQPWQRETVLAHFEYCGLPLYLKLAAEESKLWKSYTPPDACTLGGSIAGIIDTLFARLASNTNHGPVLVERSLGYLAAARYGLTEDEILDVLTADNAVWSDFDQRKHHEVSERRLPVVVWSRLSLDLEPYLMERAAPGGTGIAFYHRQLAERVAGRFLAGAELLARHSELAHYFSAKAAWLDEGRKAPNRRRAVELVFQQRGSQQWTDAEATLFNCEFLFAKCAASLILDLDADYQALLQEAPDSVLPGREALRLVHGALRLSIHVVTRDSAQFASQLLGRLLAHRDKLDIAKFVGEMTATAPRPLIRPLHPCLDAPGGALMRTLEGHSNAVLSVAVTTDGKRAVSGSADTALKVWDLGTGGLLRTLEGHSDSVYGVAVTADGKRAISASRDHTLKVWDLGTGLELRTLAGHSKPVVAVAVAADGKCAVSASSDKTLKMWDLETGDALRTLEDQSPKVAHELFAYPSCVAVTPDGRRVVSAGYHDKWLRVWDTKTGGLLRTLKGHSKEVEGLAAMADGQRVISASRDRTLKIWDVETGRLLRTLATRTTPNAIPGHSDSVNAVAVTADGKRAVSASEDKTLKVWDLETGRVLHTIEGHSTGVSCVAVTADGKRAVSASEGNTLNVWNLENGRAPSALDEGHRAMPGFVRPSICGLAVAPDGRRAASAARDGTLKVWNLDTGRALCELRTSILSWRGFCAAVTPDGKRAVFMGDAWQSKWTAGHLGPGERLGFWDLETGRALSWLEGHSGPVNGIAMTPDGGRAVSASWDKTLKIWDLGTGRLLGTLEGHSHNVEAVGVTPDGKWAVSASWDKTLKIWDLDTGRLLRTLEGHSAEVVGVAVTADGKRAVSASWDGTLKVWDLETGRVLRTLEGYSVSTHRYVYGVAVTADGKWVVSASGDDTLRVWDLEIGLARMLGDHSVQGVAVTVDGRRVIAASRDNTLKVWDLGTGLCIATFYCERSVRCCSCAATSCIVAGDDFGRVYFLALEE